MAKLNALSRKPDGDPGSSWAAIAIGLFVAFGGVLFGFVVVMSPANE